MRPGGARLQNGYFSPDSIIWRISREQLMLLGGGRALLLQVAHPLVAVGVAEHSDYRESPWRRLERTMSSVWTVVYGSKIEADRVGARVQSMHSKVHGRLPEPIGPYRAGTAYSARDPELLLWVHATLVDTALLVYQTWIGPLSETEQCEYYEDMKTLARVFGTPSAVIPPTLDDFRAYMRERLAGDEICVTAAARDICHSILNPPLPLPLRHAWRVVNLVTAGLLPPALREQYGFSWGLARRAVLSASRDSVRRLLLPLLPDMVRSIGPARAAERLIERTPELPLPV
jgi:uncharacterized protein (DUF2236 family)